MPMRCATEPQPPANRIVSSQHRPVIRSKEPTDAILGLLRHRGRPPRQRLSDALLDFGTRVQESVFQCRIDATLAEEMLTRVQRTIEENTDKVHVLSLCEACGGKVTLYGIAEAVTDPEYLII